MMFTPFYTIRVVEEGERISVFILKAFPQVFETASRKKIWDFEVGDVLWVMWHPVVPILMAG